MKTKHIFFTIAFLFTTVFIYAQDKYEFAIIQHNTAREELTISIDGEIYLTEKADLPREERYTNANPFLKKVKEYQDKGWEVLSFNNLISGSNGNVFHPIYFCNLRKKK